MDDLKEMIDRCLDPELSHFGQVQEVERYIFYLDCLSEAMVKLKFHIEAKHRENLVCGVKDVDCGEVLMTDFIEVSDTLKKWLRTVPIDILYELGDITKTFELDINEDGSTNWRKIDAFAQEVSYTIREGNNPGSLFGEVLGDG